MVHRVHFGVFMPAKKYCEYLRKITTTGAAPARKINRARILMLSNEANANASKTAEEIGELLGISTSTVYRVRMCFVEEGLESALYDKPRPGQPPKLTGKQEAQLTAIACSTPPEGRSRWTLRLLADKLVELKIVGEILKKTISSPGKENISLAYGKDP